MLFEKRSVTVVPPNLWSSGARGMQTPTGLTITPDTALSVTAVFQALRFMSFMQASLPCITYQKDRAGEDRRRAPEHPVYALLHDSPNPEMSAFDFWSTLGSHKLGRGNGLAEIQFDNSGQLQYLWPLNPGMTEIARNENYELRYLVTLPRTGERRVLRPEQVFHLRGLSREGLWGISVIAMHRNAIGLAKGTETFGSAYFGNGAEPGVVLRHPKTLSTDAHTRIRESWEQAHMGLDQAHRMAILEEGMEIEKIGFNPEDSQFLETRQFQIVEIARMFGIPPHLLFDLTNATFSNIEQQSLEFVIYHLRPWLVSDEQQIKRSLFLERERKQGYYAEFLVDAIIRGDIATRFASYQVGLNNGMYTINDVLRKENMNTIGKQGDQRFMALNMAVLDENGVPQGNSQSPQDPNTPAKNVNKNSAPPQTPPPAPPQISATSAEYLERGEQIFIKPILLDAAERILKREANELESAKERYLKKNKPEKFTAWIEEFYKRDYPAFIQTVLKPLMMAKFITGERMKEFIEQFCEQRGEDMTEVMNGAIIAIPTAEEVAGQLAGESYGSDN